MKFLLISFLALILFSGCSEIKDKFQEKKVDEKIACGGPIATGKITEMAKLNGLTMESMNSFKTLESTPMGNKCAMMYKTNDLPQPELIKYTVTYSDDMSHIIVILE